MFSSAVADCKLGIKGDKLHVILFGEGNTEHDDIQRTKVNCPLASQFRCKLRPDSFCSLDHDSRTVVRLSTFTMWQLSTCTINAIH